MRCLALATIVVGLVVALAPAAMACGGHESRAADCLTKLFGDNLNGSTITLSDHRLDISLSDGSSASGQGAEQSILNSVVDFLLAHGVQQTSQDPCDGNTHAKDVFEDENLAG